MNIHRPPAGAPRPRHDTPGGSSGHPQRSGPRLPGGQPGIARAIPAGSRRAPSQRAFLAALLRDPELAGIREDARRNVLECARVWARFAAWAGPDKMTTRPTRARLCELVRSDRRRPRCPKCRAGDREHSHPLSETSYKRARAWLQQRGWLGVVEEGTTPQFSPAVLTDLDGKNTAARYVLCVPFRKRETRIAGCADPIIGPPTGFRRKPGKAPRARDAQQGNIKPEKACPPGRPPDVPHPAAEFPTRKNPETRTERLAAAEALRGQSRLLAVLSPEHLRHLCRVLFAAGWSPADILHALEHAPGGRQYGYTASVRHVPGWVRFRLSAWLGPDGTPLPSRGQRAAAQRAAARAEQESRRRETELGAHRAAGIDVAQRVAELRAIVTSQRQAARGKTRPANGSPGNGRRA